MLECLHPDCDREFESKQGRNIHFSNHSNYKEVALNLLADTNNLTYDTCSERIGLSPAFYENNFDSWNSALEMAGVKKNRISGKIPKSNLINELIDKSENGVIKSRDIRKFGKYSVNTYRNRFGSWEAAVREAGLEQFEQTNENNPFWKGGKETQTCYYCGDSFEEYNYRESKFCSMQCKGKWQSENWTEENNPFWKGGHEKYKGESWKSQRRRARNRANGICEHPNCEKTKHDIGKKLDVHHIIPFRYYNSSKEANKLDNLILLCPEHHREEESRIWRIESVETVK
jgi:5-methylcytosine-specific restriction endonuclease McrA